MHRYAHAIQLHTLVIDLWPIIQQHRDDIHQIASRLYHLGAALSTQRDEHGRLTGRTTWGTWDTQIGLTWCWTKIVKDVFVLSDPMTIESNFTLVDHSGVAISESLMIVRMNCIAHLLPWQTEVLKAAGRRGVETGGFRR